MVEAAEASDSVALHLRIAITLEEPVQHREREVVDVAAVVKLLGRRGE